MLLAGSFSCFCSPADAPGIVPTADDQQEQMSVCHQDSPGMGGSQHDTLYYTQAHFQLFPPLSPPTRDLFSTHLTDKMATASLCSSSLSLCYISFPLRGDPAGNCGGNKSYPSRRHGVDDAVPDVCVSPYRLWWCWLSWYSTPQRQRAGTLRSTAQLIWPFTLHHLLAFDSQSHQHPSVYRSVLIIHC